MFGRFAARRVIKLFTLLCLNTIIVTVVLIPVRLISVVDFQEEGQMKTDLAMEIPDSDNSPELVDQIKSNSNTSTVLDKDTLIKMKLTILQQLVPKLFSWYEEGLKSNPPKPLANMTKDPVCALFKQEATIKRHSVLNVFGDEYPEHNSSDIDVTLATQGTITRIIPLVEAAKNWKGPMQVVLHLGYEDISNLTNVFAQSDASEHLLGRKNIIINLVVKIGNFYPINYLRNVGLNNTRTQWIFLTDIDFVPSKEVYTTALTFLGNQKANNKKVFVVPAFSGLVDNLSHFPENKQHLMELWKKREIEETQKGRAGQKNTDYKRWPNASVPYQVKWKTDYEPYIIGPTKSLPTYDEYFLQRVLDKCSHIMETSVKGFEFWVLPEVFIIHMKHERREGQEYHAGCAHDYYHKEFKTKVRKKYGPQNTKQKKPIIKNQRKTR